jgi:RNA polymerase sigma factor (sigma-70 family)
LFLLALMQQQTPQDITEQDLVLALRKGRPEALGWLYDKYSPVLLGLLSRMMRDDEIAGMLLQETFVAIWQRKESFDNSQLSLLSWLILITRDTAMAALKSGKYNERAKSTVPTYLADKATKNTTARVKESFFNLATDEKAALDLIYLRGYSCQEAAAELGISVDTLKTRLKMAGKHLREGGAKQ